ncbi:hypothetical protein IA69_10205 [Massilia sp. JS1662]|nr:hypothetical protein [Massilia sp. JS1662]KGF81930.1 hypothetical protein IA69_10205 [Massilia sp. JS1662]
MEKTMGTGQATNLLGTTVKTPQRWERADWLAPVARIARNRHRYTESRLRVTLDSDHAAGAPDQD